MPRISPQQLFKEKQAQLQKEEQEKIAQISVQSNEEQIAQINAQYKMQKIAQENEQITEQTSARTVEQVSVQNNVPETTSNTDEASTFSNKEQFQDSGSKLSNNTDNSGLTDRLQKLADKISLNDVQLELFRDRTILPRTSYTLSDEIVDMINSFYLILKKKDKRVSKQDAAEVILRQFFKDCFKTGKSKTKN